MWHMPQIRLSFSHQARVGQSLVTSTHQQTPSMHGVVVEAVEQQQPQYSPEAVEVAVNGGR
jgi:hypothetical protein